MLHTFAIAPRIAGQLPDPAVAPSLPLPCCRSLFRRLGCKLAVGMPFKDLATADSILMYEVPPASNAEARRALRRLQEVS